MLQRRPGRKLLYPAGLFSLAVIPFLIYASCYKKIFLGQSEGCIEIIYWDPKDTSGLMSSPLKFVNDKFMRITLTGAKEDEIKLAFAQVAIRELMQSEDSTMGIEFTFGKNVKYELLVKLIDICNNEGIFSYLNHEDKFWVFNLYSNKKAKSFDLIDGNHQYFNKRKSIDSGNHIKMLSL